MAIFDGYEKYRALVESALDAAYSDDQIPDGLLQGMRYAVTSPGKRIRPCIVLAIGERCGADRDQLLRLAVALETLHAASLVHDDLPDLDNDTLRRGLPTNHAKFGVANAILHGDAMINFAHTYLLEGKMSAGYARACAYLSRLAGAHGMLGGQYLDVNNEGDLDLVHRLKTAALFEVAFAVGAMCAEADEATVKSLELAGCLYGKLFQAVDDVLDTGAGKIDIGKSVGKDEASGKRTLCTVCGVEQTRAMIRYYYEQILQVDVGNANALVKELCDYTVGVIA